MKTAYEYRALARKNLQNRWGEAALASTMIIALALICSIPSIIEGVYDVQRIDLPDNTFLSLFDSSMTTLLSILVLPVQYALYITLLFRTRGAEDNIVQGTIRHAKANFTRLFLAGLATTLITTIAGLFTLGIGAIVLSYAYRMVPYLISDYPELSTREAMKVSRNMMRGYKWDLFLLDLSFIGWILLSIISLGIGSIFMVPYKETACALFYDDLRAQRIVQTED